MTIHEEHLILQRSTRTTIIIVFLIVISLLYNGLEFTDTSTPSDETSTMAWINETAVTSPAQSESFPTSGLAIIQKAGQLPQETLVEPVIVDTTAPVPTAKPTTTPATHVEIARSVSFSLDVPSYKQSDPLWATLQMGGGTATIARYGCLVTSLAMSESYRTQTAITPDIMVQSLSLSSTGYLQHWPANYILLSTKGYLSQLYRILTELKQPVLIGGRNSRSSHWVLVYGYKNVSLDAQDRPVGLNSSMFLIHDPGSKSRDTLLDYFKVYPTMQYIRYYSN